MRYLVMITRHIPHEGSFGLWEEWFSNLNDAIEEAKGKCRQYPDDVVTIEVEGWRE